MNLLSRENQSLARPLYYALLSLVLILPVLPVQAQTFKVLNNLSGDPNPATGSNFALGTDGNYYASSYQGGANNLGSIFKVTPSGTVTVIYSFTSADDGPCYPSMLLGSDGNFYGGCSQGNSGDGYLFRVTPTGTFTHLHQFVGTDGSGPVIALQGTDGNYYGFTTSGGSNDEGTIFKVTPAGTFTSVYSFGSAAYGPNGLIQGSNGDFYGVTLNPGGGIAFKITPAGVFSQIHAFAGGADDANYPGGLLQGTNGDLYGGSVFGGTDNDGVVYQLTLAGKVTILHSFNPTTDGSDSPQTPLLQANDGNIYGVAVGCSYFGCGYDGNIFEVSAKGAYTTLFTFDGTDGAGPFPGIALNPSGEFYGLTNSGGSSDYGVFYSLETGLKPFVSLLSTSAKEAAKIGILGQGFGASSVVKFGGTQATTITRYGTTFILATVPAAALSGSITVTTGSITLTSLQSFRVIPTVTKFSPAGGPVGTSVTITGTSFDQATKVTFNATSATYTVNSDTQITATVPGGATTGKIVVVTPGGSATTSTNFTVSD